MARPGLPSSLVACVTCSQLPKYRGKHENCGECSMAALPSNATRQTPNTNVANASPVRRASFAIGMLPSARESLVPSPARPVAARHPGAFLAVRGGLVDRDRRVRGQHAVHRAPHVDRDGPCHAPSNEQALGVRRVAVLVLPDARLHRVRRDRASASTAKGGLGAAVRRRRPRPRSRTSRGLAPRCGDHRAVGGRSGGARRMANSGAMGYPSRARRISSTVFGMPAVNTSEPDWVTSTSSSIRTPMPRHAAGTVSSFGAI